MNDKQFTVEKIRAQYVEKEQTELDELKALDTKVRRPANVFAWVFGSVGAIIMGAGMSLVMTDVGSYIGLTDGLIPGIIIGVAGLAMALLTWPIRKGILAARKHKYGPKILELSDKLLVK